MRSLGPVKIGEYPCALGADKAIGAFLGGVCALPSSSYGPAENCSLASHAYALSPDGTQSLVSQYDAENTSYTQNSTESPKRPICPIPPYRYRGKLSDSNGLFGSAGLVFWFVVSFALALVESRWISIGVTLTAVVFLHDFAGLADA